MNLLEYARQFGELEWLVYASSSSVYSGNTKLPLSESDPVDYPVSLYATTRKADELMGNVFYPSVRVPLTGLRFFTI